MAKRKLKVYGWQAHARSAALHKALGLPPHDRQIRLFVAAPSQAAVGRAVGESPRRLFNLATTGNEVELETAMARPGVVFASPSLRRRGDPIVVLEDFEGWVGRAE